MPVTERRIRQALGRAPLSSAWELQRLKAKEEEDDMSEFLATACVLYCDLWVPSFNSVCVAYRVWGESKSVFIVTQKSSWRWQLGSHSPRASPAGIYLLFCPCFRLDLSERERSHMFIFIFFSPLMISAFQRLSRMRRGCFRKFTQNSKSGFTVISLLD